MLVHVGAAHAGRPGRAGSPIQSARAGNLEKRAPGPERSHGACRSPPGRQHQAAPVVARGSEEAGRPSPRRLGADGRSRRTGRALAPGGGTSGLAQGKAAGRLSERRPTRRRCGTRGDARGPVGSLTAHCPGSDRPWAVQRRAPYVHSRASASPWAVRMRTARIARIADRLDGMPRCHPRVWPWWLHTHARGYAVLRLTRGDD